MKKLKSFCILLLSCFLMICIISCNSFGNKTNQIQNLFSNKDCNEEYEKITNITYSTPRSAINAMNDYLNYFDNTCEKTRDVEEIVFQFKQMENFCENSFHSLSDFISQSNSIKSTFENSQYTVVNKSWNTIFETMKNDLYTQEMDKITKDSFTNNLISDAKYICKRECCGNDLFKWEIDYVDIVEIEEPTNIENIYGKKCNGVFRVYISGPLGGRKGSIKISVLGKLVLSTDGYLNYNTIDYSILEKSGHQPRL